MEIRENFCWINDIDFDNLYEVVFSEIFYLHENFCILPKQIIEINLNVIPFNSKFWTTACIEFSKIYSNETYIINVIEINKNNISILADLGDWSIHCYFSEILKFHCYGKEKNSLCNKYPI